MLDSAVMWKAKFEMRSEPLGFEWVSCFIEFADDVLHVLGDEMRQHKTVMDFGTPPYQLLRIWLFPELSDQGLQQQVLGKAYQYRIRRGACSRLHPPTDCGRYGPPTSARHFLSAPV